MSKFTTFNGTPVKEMSLKAISAAIAEITGDSPKRLADKKSAAKRFAKVAEANGYVDPTTVESAPPAPEKKKKKNGEKKEREMVRNASGELVDKIISDAQVKAWTNPIVAERRSMRYRVEVDGDVYGSFAKACTILGIGLRGAIGARGKMVKAGAVNFKGFTFKKTDAEVTVTS